jgi:hypothetical protein
MKAMPRCWATLLFLALALVLVRPLPAEEPPATPKPVKDPRALSTEIDRVLSVLQKDASLEPVPLADDAEFLRRVSLDLIGRIPTVSEVRDFLDDRHPDKRARIVEQLLQGRGYADHFAHVWRAAWLPQVNLEAEDPTLRLSFEGWLRKRLEEDSPYDQMVREILTIRAPGSARGRQPGEPTPIAFFQANENKPENLAASTSRLFLGTKLECAQCHNHPFAPWSREQFWQYAAFFAGVENGRVRREITIPGVGMVVQARFLDDRVPEWKDGVNPRVTLADWMTGEDNKFFARAAVNRIWAHFFGTGLIEPVDELSAEEGEARELLAVLAPSFAASGYDLKFLIRAIVGSQAYQRASARSGTRSDSEDEQQLKLLGRMAVRGLSPEQLFDSLVEATGHQASGDFRRTRAEFLARFNNPTDKPTEAQRSILQALSLMNGRLVGSATSVDRSRTLSSVAEAPFLDTAGRIEALYLAALSRKPRPDERARLVAYVDRGGPTGNKRQALADVFWALLNSSEFTLNH